MSKFDELERKIRHYRWLKDIKEDYENLVGFIQQSKTFTIEGFVYRVNGGDSHNRELNPHRPIPAKCLLAGLEAALDGIEKELAKLYEELKEWL